MDRRLVEVAEIILINDYSSLLKKAQKSKDTMLVYIYFYSLGKIPENISEKLRVVCKQRKIFVPTIRNDEVCNILYEFDVLSKYYGILKDKDISAYVDNDCFLSEAIVSAIKSAMDQLDVDNADKYYNIYVNQYGLTRDIIECIRYTKNKFFRY
jgi:hypothetical protein